MDGVVLVGGWSCLGGWLELFGWVVGVVWVGERGRLEVG